MVCREIAHMLDFDALWRDWRRDQPDDAINQVAQTVWEGESHQAEQTAQQWVQTHAQRSLGLSGYFWTSPSKQSAVWNKPWDEPGVVRSSD